MNNLKLYRFINAIVLLGLIAPIIAFGQESVSKQTASKIMNVINSGKKATTEKLDSERKLVVNGVKAAKKWLKGKTLTAEEKKNLRKLEVRVGGIVALLLIMTGSLVLWKKYGNDNNSNNTNTDINHEANGSNPGNNTTSENGSGDNPTDDSKDSSSEVVKNSSSCETNSSSSDSDTDDNGIPEPKAKAPQWGKTTNKTTLDLNELRNKRNSFQTRSKTINSAIKALTKQIRELNKQLNKLNSKNNKDQFLERNHDSKTYYEDLAEKKKDIKGKIEIKENEIQKLLSSRFKVSNSSKLEILPTNP